VHWRKRILRLKEEEWLRTITGVNARSNALTNVNNKLFRATPLFAMTSRLNRLNSHRPRPPQTPAASF
jgi:hypothetical protein